MSVKNDGAVEQKRQQLISMRSELQQLEKEYEDNGKTVVLDQTRVGRLSRMDAMQAQQMALQSARRRRQLIIKIDGALSRLESGDYGYCFVCGQEISAQRLAADPTSTRCIRCV